VEKISVSLTERNVLASIVSDYVFAKNTLPALEHVLENAKRKYDDLGALVYQDLFEADPKYKLPQEEFSREIASLNKVVSELLDCEDVPRPKIHFWDDNGVYHPVRRQYISHFLQSLAWGWTGLMLPELSEHAEIVSASDLGQATFLFGVYLASSMSFLKSLGALGQSMLGKIEYEEIQNSIHYVDGYNNIFLTPLKKECLIPTLAHEWAHHIQCEKKLNWHHDTLREGHARGVQRMVSERYANARGNPAYLAMSTVLDFAELKATYLVSCSRNRVKPYLWFKKPTKRDAVEELSIKLTGAPTNHAMGNTFFSIAESIIGQRIYSDFLKCDLKIISLSDYVPA